MKRELLAMCLCGMVALAAFGQTAAAVQAADPADEDLTVITSEKLTFDYEKHFALFENNVVVVDPQMKILADKMTVFFDEKNRAKSIKCEGQVYIIQDDKKAKSNLATYDVVTGLITLSGNPQVTRGKDVLTGETIKFYRDENRMDVSGRVRAVLFPKEGETNKNLLGDPLGK